MPRGIYQTITLDKLFREIWTPSNIISEKWKYKQAISHSLWCSKILYNILGFGDEMFRTVFAGDYIVGTEKTCDHFVGNEKSLRPFCWHPTDGDDLTATKRRRPIVVHPHQTLPFSHHRCKNSNWQSHVCRPSFPSTNSITRDYNCYPPLARSRQFCVRLDSPNTT